MRRGAKMDYDSFDWLIMAMIGFGAFGFLCVLAIVIYLLLVIVGLA